MVGGTVMNIDMIVENRHLWETLNCKNAVHWKHHTVRTLSTENAAQRCALKMLHCKKAHHLMIEAYIPFYKNFTLKKKLPKCQ